DIPVFGPSKAAAQIEASKAFAKDFMKRHNIPTAEYQTFSAQNGGVEAALKYIDSVPFDVVVKASGLAAGKGVVVPETAEEAKAAVRECLEAKKFGDAGAEVVLEERMFGPECSILALCDGKRIAVLPPAQDHKRIFDGDRGPNTGGMGAFAPTPVVKPEMMEQIRKEILMPTIDGLRAEGKPFIGCLFAGLMITASGPKVIEFNCRFGDPETQAVLPLLECDLYHVLNSCASGELVNPDTAIGVSENTCAVSVTMASGGYPENFEKGYRISGLERACIVPGVTIFHAGTKPVDNTSLRLAANGGSGALQRMLHHRMMTRGVTKPTSCLTSGGRVLAVTAVANGGIAEARERAYVAVRSIRFEKCHYRKDIGSSAIEIPRPRTRSGAEISSMASLHHHSEHKTGQPHRKSSATYLEAGVDIEMDEAIRAGTRNLMTKTNRPGCELAGPDGEEAHCAVKALGYEAPEVVSSTNGIGTKLKVATAMGQFRSIGTDLLALCANDIAARGAEPLMFSSHHSCCQLDAQQALEVNEGVAEGCREAVCAFTEAKTAEMPGVYNSCSFDLVGFAVGAAERGKLLPQREAMKEGDVLIGLSSSGLHSNGFSLLRSVVQAAGIRYQAAAPFDPTRSFGEVLLAPTRIYVKTILALAKEGLLRGAAPITRGGLSRSVPRILPKHLKALVKAENWELPPLFRWIAARCNIPCDELAATFNCGIGMVLITAQEHKDEVMTRLKDMDEEAHIIGELLPRKDGQGQMHIAGACLLELQPHFSHLPSDSSDMEGLLRLLPGLCSRAPADAFRELSSQAGSCKEAEVLLASLLYRRKISKDLVSDEAAAAGVFLHAKAAAQSSHLGLALLGCAYLDGLGVQADAQRAVELLSQAAEQGSAAAKCSLSYCCEKGLGLKQDQGRAKELLQESASQGYAHALFKLGCCCQYGILGTEIQLQEAHRLYVEASRQGHPAGMAQLGRSFADGAGVPVDKAEACRWLRLAADAGNRDAMYGLALAYRHGDGVEVDLSMATELYRQGGNLGHPQAQAALYNLGCCYMNSTGVPRDPQAAVDCFRRAAEQGDMDAHVSLGKCFLTGEGVARDQAEAQRLLMLAADHGHPAGLSFAQFHKAVHPDGAESCWLMLPELGVSLPFPQVLSSLQDPHMVSRSQVLIMGGSARATPLKALLEAMEIWTYPAEVSAVVSLCNDSALVKAATKAGLKTFVADPELQQSNGHAFAPPPRGAESYVETLLEKVLEQHRADLIVLMDDFGLSLLPPSFRQRWAGKLLSVRASLLPLAKDQDPIESVLEMGACVTGCTVFQPTADLVGEGEIMLQETARVLDSDTPDSLHERIVAEAERKALPEAVRLVASGKYKSRRSSPPDAAAMETSLPTPSMPSSAKLAGDAKRYEQRGVSADKGDVHAAIKNMDKGLFPRAFCKVVPDFISRDPTQAIVMHADGAGTKSSLAYIYWKKTGDISVWKGIAQDALVMNLDDLPFGPQRVRVKASGFARFRLRVLAVIRLNVRDTSSPVARHPEPLEFQTSHLKLLDVTYFFLFIYIGACSRM
ncbi:purD, partial [Symbiodinium microadriaticum]